MPQFSGLRITLFHDDAQVRVVDFDKAKVLVGRDPLSADLVLDSTHVSRRHVLIEHDGSRVFIRDAGSKNGVWVNDERVVSREVGPKEHIIVGDYALEVAGIAAMQDDVAAQRADTEPGAAQPVPSSAQLTYVGEPAPRPKAHQDLGTAVDAADTPITAPQSVAQPYNPFDAPERPALTERPFAIDPSAADSVDLGRFGIDHVALDEDADEDDHDEDEHGFVPPYSLSKRLLQSSGAVVGRSPGLGLEMVCVVSEQVANFALLPVRRRPYRLGHDMGGGQSKAPGLRQLHPVRQGESLITCDAGVSGRLRRDNAQVDLERFFVSHKRNQMQGTLKKGDVLSLFDGHAYYHLRHLPLPPVPPDRRPWWVRAGLEGHTWRTSLASVFTHAFLALVLTILVPDNPPKPPAPEFTVALKKEPQLQEPEPKPKPPTPPKIKQPKPPRPKAKPLPVHKPQPKAPPAPKPQVKAPPAPKPVAKPAPEPTPTPPTPTPPPPPVKPVPKPILAPAPALPSTPPNPRQRPSFDPQSSQTPEPTPPAGILGLLAKRGSAQAPGPSAAVDAVTNLAAAHAPANAGGYRVSGLVGKLPTSSGISFGGGHGNMVTKGANALLRGGVGGTGALRGHGTAHIGGFVQSPARGVTIGGGGSLDRKEIDKVVNAHADEIQRCYERELAHDRSIAGKVEIKWVIATDGHVSTTSVVFDNLGSPAATRCILEAIRSWKFPKPVGGGVLVNYPWVFNIEG